MTRLALSLLGLMTVGCASPQPPADLNFELVSPSGEVVGDAQLSRASGFTRCQTQDGAMQEQAWHTAEGWQLRTHLSGLNANTQVLTQPEGLAWERSQGVSLSRQQLALPRLSILSQAPQLISAPAWSCGLAEARSALLAPLGEQAGLSVQLGEALTVSLERRATTTRTLDGEAIQARRLLLRTHNFARTLWVDDNDELLELWPSTGFSTLRRVGLDPLPAQLPDLPEGVTEHRITLQGAPSLNAAITLPPQPQQQQQPGVVLVHGSGASDLDGNSPALNLWVLQQLAGRLSAQGVAVARYDKRTEGDGSLDALASDANRALSELRQRPEVQSSCTFLAGHSEGGAVVIRAAGSEPVAGLLLLASPVGPFELLLRNQLVRLLEAAGAPEHTLQQATTSQRALLRAVSSGADRDLSALGLGEESADWLRDRLSAAPGQELQALALPTLALYFDQDLQVAPEDAPGLESLQQQPWFSLRSLPDIDHVMRPVAGMTGTGNYMDPDLSPSPAVAEAMLDWLNDQPCVQTLNGPERASRGGAEVIGRLP